MKIGDTPINNFHIEFSNDKINIYPQSDGQRRQPCNNEIQSKLTSNQQKKRINRRKDYFMADICERDTMSKTML